MRWFLLGELQAPGTQHPAQAAGEAELHKAHHAAGHCLPCSERQVFEVIKAQSS